MAEHADSTLDSPFVGLQPYAEEHRLYFFGRSRERRLIAANLYASRVSVLYGPSGVGKSSLLQAGVAADLRRAPRTVVVYFNEWHDDTFLKRLKQACLDAASAAGTQAPALDSTAPLDELLGELQQASRSTILILLDQFEEYFLYHAEEETTHTFDAELARTINRNDLQVNFIIALRDDWLTRLDRFRTRIPHLLANTLRLTHLDAAAAAEAIRKPLAVWNERHSAAGAGIEDNLVGEIIHDVRTGRVSLTDLAGVGEAKGGRDRDEIETAFLQLVLTNLWHAELATAGVPFLRLATYERLGRASKIVQALLNESLDQLTEDERDSCARMFPYLVTPSGSKIAHETSDLIAFAERPREQIVPLLTKLANRSVLRRIAQPERYEIFHDVLAPAILDWRTRHIDARQQEQRRRSVEIQERLALARERTNRRNAALVSAGALVVILLFGIAASALLSSKLAQERSDRLLHEAKATQLLSVAERLQDTQYDLSLLLNLEASRLFPARDEPAGILRRLQSHPHLKTYLRCDEADRSNAVAFRPDGSRIATGCGPSVIIWDLAGRRMMDLATGGNRVVSLAFSADGARLASGSSDGTLVLWEVGSGKQLGRSSALKSPVFNIAFGPDGTRLASSSVDGSVTLWDVEHLAPVARIKNPIPDASVVGFSLDLRQIVLANRSGSIVFWDVDKSRSTSVLPAESLGAVALSADGRRLATATFHGLVVVWDLARHKPFATLEDVPSGSLIFALSTDGSVLASANRDQTITLWHVARPKPFATLRGQSSQVRSLALNADGSYIASVGSDQTTIIWDMVHQQGVTQFFGDGYSARQVAFSPDGKLFGAATSRGTVFVWDGNNSTPLLHRQTIDRFLLPGMIAFSPDAQQLVSIDLKRVDLWDLVSGRNTTIASDPEFASAVAFSADGRQVAGSFGATMSFWDARSGERLTTWHNEGGKIHGIAYSPDGKRVAMACQAGLALRDVGGTRPVSFLTNGQGLRSVAFSPDGKLLAAGSVDGTVFLWSSSGEQLAPLIGHADPVTSVAFDRTGKLLASASLGFREGGVILWDLDRGQALATFTAGGVAVAFRPDGKRLAAGITAWGKGESTAVMWNLDFDQLSREACRTVNRDLTRQEWKTYMGSAWPYHKTCG